MRLGRTTGIVVSLMTLAALAHAQSVALSGTVVDRWENAVPDAKLTLTNPQTGAALSATATQTGGYVFSQTPLGRYDLSVRADGFKPYTRRGIEIASEAASQLDVRLDPEKDDSGTDVKALETLAASKPGDYLARFNLGRAYFAKGQIEKALREVQEAMKLRPDYKPANVAMAQLAMRAGASAFALQLAQGMLSLRPGSGLAAMLAAQSYQRVGQPDEAADLGNFLSTNPNDSEVLIELGSVNLQRKQYPEAEKAFSRAYSLDPSSARGVEGLIEVRLLRKEPEKAVQLIAAEVEKNPQRTDLRRELAATELQARQVDKAIADYRSILEKYKDAPKEQAVVYASLGEAYQVKEDFPSAIENLKKAMELAPDNSAYVSSLAGVYDRSGKPQEALASYQQALKIDPGNALVMNNLAYLLVKSGGDVDEALRLVQMARRQFPDASEILDTLGWIYLKKDMVDSASQIFQDLIEKAQSNPTFHYHYAMALAKKGDKAAALRELDLALKNNPAKVEEEEIREWIKKLS